MCSSRPWPCWCFYSLQTLERKSPLVSAWIFGRTLRLEVHPQDELLRVTVASAEVHLGPRACSLHTDLLAQAAGGHERVLVQVLSCTDVSFWECCRFWDPLMERPAQSASKGLCVLSDYYLTFSLGTVSLHCACRAVFSSVSACFVYCCTQHNPYNCSHMKIRKVGF